jgi:hypothetical protein
MGACRGADAFPKEAVLSLEAVNPELKLEPLAAALFALRAKGTG